MPLNKVFSSAAAAVADISDGAVIMISGFGRPGVPETLVRALLEKKPKGLTVISNACHGRFPDWYDAGRLVDAGLVTRAITSFPVAPGLGSPAERLWKMGLLDIETIPQGILAERIRAGGAGLGGFWIETGIGTAFSSGAEKRIFDGQQNLLQLPLEADFALIRASRADSYGNLVYHRAQRNFGPIMAAAAKVTLAEVAELDESGSLNPELVITPGIYVDRIVCIRST